MTIIFDMSRHDYDYKGVLFAKVDTAESAAEMGMPPTPKDYCAVVMGIIWTDEKGGWHAKVRIKFPSGNKQVITLDFTKPEYKNIRINETYALT